MAKYPNLTSLIIVPEMPTGLLSWRPVEFYGAGDEIRTRDPYLGKVMLYH